MRFWPNILKGLEGLTKGAKPLSPQAGYVVASAPPPQHQPRVYPDTKITILTNNNLDTAILPQYPTGIPVAIPVTAGIRGFAGIAVPGFTLNLVIKTCQKIKNFQQKFDKKHVKFNTDFKLKVVIFFTQ